MHAFSLSKRVLHFLGFKESASLVLLSLTERDETFIGTKLSDRDCTSEDQFLLRRNVNTDQYCNHVRLLCARGSDQIRSHVAVLLLLTGRGNVTVLID
jgi:hypothetical protein